MLRQVKLRVPGPLHTKDGYLPVGKAWLGAAHLAPQRGAPPRMPASLRAWCEEEAESTIAWLRGRGVDVAGDLDDLRPLDGDFVEDPRLDADTIAEAALAALTSIAVERIHDRRERQERRTLDEQDQAEDLAEGQAD